MNRQSGNALWFILIAIALLGLLGAMLIRTSSQTEETGDKDRLSVAVSQLVRYTSSVASAAQNMLLRGVSESEISFANDVYQECDDDPIQAAGHNPNCTTEDCEIFGLGGGLEPREIPSDLLTDGACSVWKIGSAAVNTRTVVDVGTNKPDLVLEVYGLSEEACVMINKLAKVSMPADSPPDDEEGIGGTDIFTGDYTISTSTIGDEATELEGKKVFCLHRPSEDSYHMYTVLIAR
ncbi:MAG TPA: hypothetical protein VFS88_09890 [Micavibrio sp.]|nr:hypothetical protein [Micavibrio sp.]